MTLWPRNEAGPWGALGALVAAVTLGQAIQASNGALHPAAIKHLGVALGALVFAVAFSQARGPAWLGPKIPLVLGGGAVVFQLYQLASGSPGIYLRGVAFPDYAGVLVVFAALSAALLAGGPRRWLLVVAWLASFAWLGAWLLKASPEPFIDVFAWTNHGLKALGEGKNPFETWMPNIYRHTQWYAPGMADAEWVKTGYPYPPFSLMLSGLGYLAGDMRWANLALLGAAGAAMCWSRTRLGALGAVVLLTTPRVLFVLEQAWTDAYVVGLVGLVALSAVRAPRLTGVLFGLLLSTKQYMIFAVPLGFLLIPPPWDRRKVLRFVLEAVIAGTVVTLPWLLWNPKALLGSLLVSGHPFRPDSLSFLAWTAVDGQPRFPLYVQFVPLALAYVLVFFRGARGPAGFALAFALVFNVFFAFSKHAFCNHHFLPLGCAAIALAFVAREGAHQATTAKS